MASQPIIDAGVLQFTGKRHGPIFLRTEGQFEEEQQTARDARLIRNSEGGAAMAIVLAIVSTMPATQRAKVKNLLDIRALWGGADYEEAQALFRYASASLEKRQPIIRCLAASNPEKIL